MEHAIRTSGTNTRHPHLLDDLNHEAQLRILLLEREAVAFDGGEETALGCEAQLVERHELVRLVDPSLQCSVRVSSSARRSW